MPRGRTRIRTAHCSLAAALTVMGLRHRPQSGSYRDRARLPQTYATTVVGPSAAIRSALAIPSSSCLPFAKALRTLNRGKICATCMIRGARAAKSAPSWQDIHVVYPPTAFCRAFRMHGAHILPKPARFGCMARESCHELAIFPPEAAFGMHGAQNLPRIAARERTAAKSCHGKAPGCASRENLVTVGRRGNAFRGHFAIGERPGTHQGTILPSPGARKQTNEELA